MNQMTPHWDLFNDGKITQAAMTAVIKEMLLNVSKSI